MRSFEERKAEVFLRSENRIKVRNRKRKQILAICIPLCLIVTAFSFTLFPRMLFDGTDGAENNMGSLSSELEDKEMAQNSSIAHDFISVDVKGTGAQSQYHSTITDPIRISGVFEEIYHILIPYELHHDIVGGLAEGSTDLPDSNVSDEVKDSTGSTKASGYVITMTDSNGVNRTFTFTEDKLYDSELELEIDLTGEQIHGLKSALGLTD